jgi:hypothetical protein
VVRSGCFNGSATCTIMARSYIAPREQTYRPPSYSFFITPTYFPSSWRSFLKIGRQSPTNTHFSCYSKSICLTNRFRVLPDRIYLCSAAWLPLPTRKPFRSSYQVISSTQVTTTTSLCPNLWSMPRFCMANSTCA